jgi:hypothetical protein
MRYCLISLHGEIISQTNQQNKNVRWQYNETSNKNKPFLPGQSFWRVLLMLVEPNNKLGYEALGYDPSLPFIFQKILTHFFL